MTTLLNGLLGGLLIGFLGGIAVQLVDNKPPATSVLLERAVGGRPATSRWRGLAVQAVYGGLAGITLLALELYVLGVLGVPPSFGEAFGVTLAWSALLLVTWVVAWQVVPSLPSDRSYLVELILYHLVYGLGLGLWIRITWIT